MGAKKGAKVRIVKKNDDYSQDYQVGDVFTVEGTWYGGIHVTTPSGVPLSLDEEEYELADVERGRPVDRYSYELGVMDCFCEMVAAGLKRLAMSHPCDTREERDSYQEAVEALCRRYGVCFQIPILHHRLPGKPHPVASPYCEKPLTDLVLKGIEGIISHTFHRLPQLPLRNPPEPFSPSLSQLPSFRHPVLPVSIPEK